MRNKVYQPEVVELEATVPAAEQHNQLVGRAVIENY